MSEHHEAPPMLADPPRPLRALSLYLGGALLVLLCAGAVLALQLRHRVRLRHEAALRERALRAGPVVRVAEARPSPPERTLTLQGEARPFASVTLYAKVSGYLREIRVDKGDAVKKDQVVAVIESPEIDRQYQAALADARNKRAVAARADSLVGPGVVSVQEQELARAQAQVAQAALQTQETLRGYQLIRAPFDGTVTARFADPGALVQSATSAQTGALPVVSVADLSRLRVYVYPSQFDAGFIRIGDPATIAVQERPDLRRTGQVARVSGALDPRTRTMLVESDLDNRDRQIVPGSFLDVSLTVRTPSYMEVPSEALVLRGERTLVATVAPDDTAHFREVRVASDDGHTVRLLSGLRAGERVALNLGDSVPEGAKVQPVTAPPAQGGQAGAQGSQGQAEGRAATNRHAGPTNNQATSQGNSSPH